MPDPRFASPFGRDVKNTGRTSAMWRSWSVRFSLGMLWAVSAVVGGAAWPTVAAAQEPRTANFKGAFSAPLSTPDDRQVRLTDLVQGKRGLVIALVGTECPLVDRYWPRLAELQTEFSGRQIGFVALDANLQDSVEEIRAMVARHATSIPVLIDRQQQVAQALDARRTPEVFLIDATLRIRYRGRIDDQYGMGYRRPDAQEHFLAQALEALLADQEIRVPQTEAIGCLIGRLREPDPASPVTWSRQVVRIFQRRCQECHRGGGIGPMPLVNYHDVVGWQDMIAEVVRSRRMPPWHANPQIGEFANDARLSEQEMADIHTWIERGVPAGNPADLPPPLSFPDGWPKGQPDRVIAMSDRPFRVPAHGRAEYAYFFVDPQFEKDLWVKGSWCRPGNTRVVHHINVYFRPPWQSWNDWLGGTVNLLSGFLPGQTVSAVENTGSALFIPKGSELLFEMHYTPNGREEEDLSSVGLVFASPEEVRREAFHAAAFNATFAIPPYAKRHVVRAEYTAAEDVQLEFMSPHMHLRGKDFRYDAQYPDGQRETLLEVQNYDYEWQTVYWLREPKTLPLGTRILCQAVYDNSPQNLRNPDPAATVRWSGYTEDEMMVGVLGLSRNFAPVKSAHPKTPPRAGLSSPSSDAATSPVGAVVGVPAAGWRARSAGENFLDRAQFLLARREWRLALPQLDLATRAFAQEFWSGPRRGQAVLGAFRTGGHKLLTYIQWYRYRLAAYLLALNALAVFVGWLSRRTSGVGAKGFFAKLLTGLALAGATPVAWWLDHTRRDSGTTPCKRHWAMVTVVQVLVAGLLFGWIV